MASTNELISMVCRRERDKYWPGKIGSRSVSNDVIGAGFDTARSVLSENSQRATGFLVVRRVVVVRIMFGFGLGAASSLHTISAAVFMFGRRSGIVMVNLSFFDRNTDYAIWVS